MANRRLSYTVSSNRISSPYNINGSRRQFAVGTISQRPISSSSGIWVKTPIQTPVKTYSFFRTSERNVNYSTASSFLRIVFMLVLLLSYCKVVFGGEELSPFDTGLDMAQSISDFGTTAKEDFIKSLDSLKSDFADMKKLNPLNWGSIDSFGTFMTSVGSMFTAPFNLIKFFFSLLFSIIKLLNGLSNFIFGV